MRFEFYKGHQGQWPQGGLRPCFPSHRFALILKEVIISEEERIFSRNCVAHCWLHHFLWDHCKGLWSYLTIETCETLVYILQWWQCSCVPSLWNEPEWNDRVGGGENLLQELCSQQLFTHCWWQNLCRRFGSPPGWFPLGSFQRLRSYLEIKLEYYKSVDCRIS